MVVIGTIEVEWSEHAALGSVCPPRLICIAPSSRESIGFECGSRQRDRPPRPRAVQRRLAEPPAGLRSENPFLFQKFIVCHRQIGGPRPARAPSTARGSPREHARETRQGGQPIHARQPHVGGRESPPAAARQQQAEGLSGRRRAAAPPSKVAEKGEVAAAISAAGVTTVKEEAVQQGEQDIDKVYKFRDAILEGATALNIETKAELVELFTKHAIESTSGEKVVPRKYFDELLTELKVDAKDPFHIMDRRAFRERERDVK